MEAEMEVRQNTVFPEFVRFRTPLPLLTSFTGIFGNKQEEIIQSRNITPSNPQQDSEFERRFLAEVQPQHRA